MLEGGGGGGGGSDMLTCKLGTCILKVFSTTLRIASV